jgi:hypothetical protein
MEMIPENPDVAKIWSTKGVREKTQKWLSAG